MKFCRAYSTLGANVSRIVHEKEVQLMRQLTRIVFNKWYTDLLQENLKVVPDLNDTKTAGTALHNADADDQNARSP